MNEKNPIAVDEALLRAEAIFNHLDVREATRKDYKARIGAFLTFVQENGMNRDTFLLYKRMLSLRNSIATNTKNKHIVVAKVFLKELNRQGLLPVDITQNVRGFSESKKHKREGLSEQEIQLVSTEIHNYIQSPANARLKVILCLLTLQGMRQIEVIRLNVKDIDLVAQTAQILGKGRDDMESIALHPETVKAIQTYLATNMIADGALFVSRSNHGKNQRLTTRGLRGIVKRLLTQLRIEKTTHGFRHYFVTRLIEAYKADLLMVAHYSRHRSVETLQIYNDSMKYKTDLPRFYKTFSSVQF